MLSIWLSEIQKNIWVLSDLVEPIRIVDKKRNIWLATVIWVWKKRSILNIWWVFKNKIPKNKQNLDFSEVRKQARDLYLTQEVWKK